MLHVLDRTLCCYLPLVSNVDITVNVIISLDSASLSQNPQMRSDSLSACVDQIAVLSRPLSNFLQIIGRSPVLPSVS